MTRIWDGGLEGDQQDTIALCPGRGVSKEDNMYEFILADEGIVTITCPGDGKLCKLSGNGLVIFCYVGADCLTNVCYTSDYHYPGVCACSTMTNAGCEENEVCLGCEEFHEQAYGGSGSDYEDCERQAVIQIKCYRNIAETCRYSGSCSTGFCEDGICVCSPKTGYPCDVHTEYCANATCQTGSPCRHKPYKVSRPKVGPATINKDNVTDMYDCCLEDGVVKLTLEWKVTTGDVEIVLCPGKGVTKEGDTYQYTHAGGTSVEINCVDNSGLCTVAGDGIQTYWCLRDEHCNTGACSYQPGDTRTGSCTCNVDTNAGCSDELQCADGNTIRDITGYWDEEDTFYNRNRCYSKVGEPCVSYRSCLTRNCVRSCCACTTYSNYPCDVDNGEKCVLQGSTYICQ